MKKIILLSQILTTFLFFGCGGESRSSAFEISSSASEYIVVEGMKKDVVLSTNKVNVTFEFVDKREAPDTELDSRSGILVYRAPISSADQNIVVKAIDAEGKESEPLTLSFQTVSSDINPTQSIVQTGVDDGGIGITRNFDKNSDDYVIDPFGNIWENTLEGKSLENTIYITAKTRCEILRLTNIGTQWRIPTADELLNLMDYSKVSGASMLDDTFEDINLTSWVESEDDQYLVVTQSNGLFREVSFTDKYPVRCINAPKSDDNHIISTDRFNNKATIDFSTGLQWSPMPETEEAFKKIIDDVNQSAPEYCAEYDNSSGWRLPSINEVRSIVENESISTFIMGNNSIIVSSTPYNDSNSTARVAHYLMGFDENNKILHSISYADIAYPITCVKER